MANYGRTTQGASWQEIENDVQGRLITLPGGESISSTMAYLQTTNGSSATVKSALYNSSTLALVYESNTLTFTDDTGGLKTITWPATTPTAGSYYIVVAAGTIAGGANTVNIAVDVVGSSATYIRSSGGAPSFPTLPNPLVDDNSTYDSSVYLVTASGGGSARAKKRILRAGFQSGMRGGF